MMCRFVRIDLNGIVSTDPDEPGRVTMSMTDDLGTPPLHWLVAPCDRARLAEVLTAAIDLFEAEDMGTAKPELPPEPAPVEPPPEGAATRRRRPDGFTEHRNPREGIFADDDDRRADRDDHRAGRDR